MKTPPLPPPEIKRFEETKLEDLPRDPRRDASGWSFKTLEHNQHTFPTMIEAMDAEGRSCLYVPFEFAGRIGRWK